MHVLQAIGSGQDPHQFQYLATYTVGNARERLTIAKGMGRVNWGIGINNLIEFIPD